MTIAAPLRAEAADDEHREGDALLVLSGPAAGRLQQGAYLQIYDVILYSSDWLEVSHRPGQNHVIFEARAFRILFDKSNPSCRALQHE